MKGRRLQGGSQGEGGGRGRRYDITGLAQGPEHGDPRPGSTGMGRLLSLHTPCHPSGHLHGKCQKTPPRWATAHLRMRHGRPGIFLSPYCFLDLSCPSFASFSRPLGEKAHQRPTGSLLALVPAVQAWLAIPGWSFLSYRTEACRSHVRAGHSVCTACAYLSKRFTSLQCALQRCLVGRGM